MKVKKLEVYLSVKRAGVKNERKKERKKGRNNFILRR